MKPASAKCKGRRLQTQLAETLAVRFDLTIDATPPTKPGARPNGAVYVPVHAFPDLRVKRMGEAGADVELLTPRAIERVQLDGYPIWFECKNVENGWDIGAGFWRSGNLAVVADAFEQASAARPIETTSVIVLAKNRHPMLAAWLARSFQPPPVMAPRLMLQVRDDLVVLAPFDLFMTHAFGW